MINEHLSDCRHMQHMSVCKILDDKLLDIFLSLGLAVVAQLEPFRLSDVTTTTSILRVSRMFSMTACG